MEPTKYPMITFLCRIRYTKNLGFDDYSIAVALAVAITLGIMNGFHISYGAGTHPIGYMVNPELAYIPNLKHWYAYQIVYPLSLALVKASFLALYYRVFPPPNMNRVMFWGVSVFIAAYTVAIILVNAFECPKNPSDAWKASFPRNSPDCNDVPTVYYTMAAINILTDLFVLILPIAPALNLKINRRKKAAIIGIFLIGFIAVIASCLRVYFVYKYFNSRDPAFDTIEILLWSQIELNVAVVCSSIASLRPMFKSAFGGSGPRSNSALRYTPNGRSGFSASRHEQHDFELKAKESRGRPKSKVEAQLVSLDNDSTEYILRLDDGIKRTVETTVTSEEIRRDGHMFTKESAV
ncbi:hypothetical protein MBLNU13_g07360t1 [Cladosporium sp. NU13]